ncbi:MAG: amino acid adenylation domain-containing protein, partial [Candidatus Aminicenantes bacterium]
RIELGEIESRLLSHPEVKEAVVLAISGQISTTQEDGDGYLCAYIVPDGAFGSGTSPISTPGAPVLKEHLSHFLPDYMIPSYFMEIEKIPLNPNGKIDRKALPVPVFQREDRCTPPRDTIELELVKIWSEVLGRNASHASQLRTSPGIDHNFFELGGHSLNATIMVAKIHKALDVKVPLGEVFIRPTIRELGEYIKNTITDRYTSIEPVEKKEYYILSPAQKRLYILQQLDQSGTVYNMPEVIPLPGEPDIVKLEETFKKLIRRHESLRTSFHMVSEQPVQKIHHHVEFKIESYLATEDTENTEGEPAAPIISNFIRPFDLTRAPLLRIGLLETPGQQHLLLVDMHHIISDGISHGILMGDFTALYQGERLPRLRIQYKDFSQWLNHPRQKEKLKKQEAYWLSQFEGEIPVLDLPTDFPRPAIQSFAGHTLNFHLDQVQTGALKTTAFENGASLFMVLSTLIHILLAKLSSQEDIVIGTPVAGRRHAELDNIMGMFVNTLALRNYPINEKSFIEFLTDVKARTLEAFENQEYPFEELVEKVEVNRDVSRNPLFDVMFALNVLEPSDSPGPDENKPTETDSGKAFETDSTAKFDLTIVAADAGNQLSFSLQYCTELFNRETIQRFIRYFSQITADILENKNKPIGHLEIITPAEKREILDVFNKTAADYPRHKTICQLFTDQVKCTPHHVALVAQIKNHKSQITNKSVSISYKELNQRSNQLAGYLRKQGGKELIGIMLERTPEMMVGILGILKAGCGYVPLNPKAPGTRILYMLDECSVNLLVTTRTLSETFDAAKEMVYLEEFGQSAPEGPGGPDEEKLAVDLGSSLEPSNLAYVIFTSGSTGNPKGVPITHSNLSPLLHWGYRDLGIDSTDRTLQNLSYYFDWSVWEIFITLTTGASLYMVPDEILLNPAESIGFMRKHGITVLHATPTQYSYIANVGERLETLKYLFIGAEKLSYDLLERSFKTVNENCRVFNMYGPTECTIIASVLEIDRSDDIHHRYGNLSSIPIGVPVGNTYLLVLDKYSHLCPVNVVGELYIGGDGVALGYLNDPGKTGKSFPKNIYKTGNIKGPCLYKTGDLSRWLPDGTIEFLGRIDHQIKIRGFRIELGEIETQLLKHPVIKEAVVMATEAISADKYLCAYIVTNTKFDSTELRGYLSLFLPDYMIPDYFVSLEKIPLTPNGKIDRKALPEPGLKSETPYAPPQDVTEEKLVRIWSEVLAIEKEKISIRASFFQMGGHSLKASIAIAKIRKEFNIEMPLSELFKTPTIQSLAKYIKISGIKTPGKITISEKNLVLIKPGKSNLHHLFFLHDGTGEVEGYVEFCQHLEETLDFNCWGIQAEKMKNPGPKNVTIEEIARKYIPKIKTLQPQGPYFIVGWSIGGTIAFEIVKQLEQKKEEVAFLALIDSLSPQQCAIKNIPMFSLESEKNFIKKYLSDRKFEKELDHTVDMENIWLFIIDYLESHHFDVEIIKKAIVEFEAQVVPGYHQLSIAELIRYLNLGRTFHQARAAYIPSGKVKTTVHFFKASESQFKQQSWNNYCLRPIKSHQIEGNHFSIMQMPQVISFARIFTRVIKK